MKRTLALILTLCMALSMFSFPALAAELDAAPLETAPVETQTTTPAETPAAAGDVVAPAAAEAEGTAPVQVTITDEDAKNQTHVFDGKAHGFTALEGDDYTITYTDKEGNTQSYSGSSVTVEYSLNGQDWTENVPAQTWKNVGSANVQVRFTPADAAPDGYLEWGSAVVNCSIVITPFQVNMATTTASFASDSNCKFDAEWDVPTLTIKLNNSDDNAAVLAEMGEPELKFYSDATLQTEILADDLNQHVGKIYVTAQLDNTSDNSDNWTFDANNGLLGATGDLSFTIHANDALEPTAKLDQDTYVVPYTGKEIDFLKDENVSFTGKYADIEATLGEVKFAEAKGDIEKANYSIASVITGDYYVRAAVTNDAYFGMTVAYAYAKVSVEKTEITVTMPADMAEYGFTNKPVEYATGIKTDPSTAIGLLKVTYTGLGETNYPASTNAPTVPGTYRATVSVQETYEDNVTISGTTESDFKIVPEKLNASLTVNDEAKSTVADLADDITLTYNLASNNDVIPQSVEESWVITAPDGKTYTASTLANINDSDPLEVGRYEIKAILTPTEKTDSVGTYTTFVQTEVTGSYTVESEGTKVVFHKGSGQDVTFTYDGAAHDLAALLNEAYDGKTPDYVVRTGSATTSPDITDEFDKYEIVLIAQNEDGEWEPVESVTDAGTYYITALSTADDGIFVNDLAKWGIKVEIAKKYLKVEYTPITVEYDKKDHKDDVTLASFVGVTAEGQKVEITKENCNPDEENYITWTDNEVKNVGEYTFTASFTFDNYKDATVTGTLKIIGVGNVSVQFKETSYGEPYNGKAQRVTSNDYVIRNADDEAVASARVWYTDANGKALSGEPKNAGTYTAHVTVPSVNNKNEATAEVPFVIAKADAEIKWNALSANTNAADKAIKYSENIAADLVANLQTTATVTGVAAGDPAITSASVTYKYYLDGELLTMENSDGETVPADWAYVTKDVKPGVYTATAQWLNEKTENGKTEAEDANYNASELITSNKVTVETAALENVPTFDASKAKIAYGDVIEGHKLYTTEDPDIEGYFYTTGAGQVTKTGAQIFTVMFQATEGAYEPAVVGLKTINAANAKLTEEDVKITNTEVAAYDGKEYALTGAEVVNKKFDTDKFTIKFSKDNATWKDNIGDVTYSAAGSNIVWVQFSADNYDTVSFPGYVAIGVAKSTLSVADVTAPYEFSTEKIQPKVTITTEGGKTETVDPKYLNFYVGEYEEDKELTRYTKDMQLKDAHVVEDGYWVRVEVKPEALTGDLSSYYLGDGTTVYARYIVTKADLDESLLPSYISDKKIETTYNGSELSASPVASLGVVTEKDPMPEKPYTGSWDWADADQIMAPDADFTVQFTPSGMGGKEANDYNLPTATVNVVVSPEKITVNAADVTWTPEEADYGLTLGDISVEGLEDVVVTSTIDDELEGTWVWEKGSDYVVPVTTSTTPDYEGDPYDLIFVANENHTCYDARVTVKVIINKATPTLEVTNTTMEYNGNPAALNVVTNSDANEANYTFVWRDENGNRITAAPTEVGTYQVTVTIPETANFESVSKTVSFEITYNAHFDGVEGFVTRLYQVALGRTPDASGYKLWVNGLKSGEYTPEFVAYGFIFSREFTNKNLSNADFLTIMYNTFMDRDPDADGYAMWLNGLNSGEFTREFVFNGFVYSKEFTDICARYGL